jgi:pyruvate carboxylase subunit B
MGYYGRPPGEVNEEIRKMVIGDIAPIDVRPADLIPPELEKLKADGHQLGIIHKEEDLITYALYPQVAVKFLRGELKEEALQPAVKPRTAESSSIDFPTEFAVDVDGEVFNIKISPTLGKPVEVEKPRKSRNATKGSIAAPMSGMILSIKVKESDIVKEGDLVAMIEAMKMQNEIRAPFNGVIKEIMSYEGEVVTSGDVLIVMEPNDK